MAMDYGSMGSGAGLSVMGIAQFLTGYLDQKKNKRPDYNIPTEFQENLNDAQNMALEGIPEASKQQYLSNIERGSAFGLRELGSRNAGIAGVGQLNQNMNDAYSNMAAQDAMARAENKRLVMAARDAMGNEKKEQFALNQLNPYYERTAKNQALMGSGAQNLGNGIQTFGGSQGSTQNPTDSIKSNSNSGMNSQTGMNNYNSDSIEYDQSNGSYGNDGIAGMYSGYS